MARDSETTMKFVKIGVAVALFAAAGVAYFVLNKRPLPVDEPASAAAAPTDATKPAEVTRPALQLPDQPADVPKGGPRKNPDAKPGN
jgi:hypothetical protein